MATFDLGRKAVPWDTRRDAGKKLRDKTPRANHAVWKPSVNRADPLEILSAQNAHRAPELVPIRMGRMAKSPFAYMRGAAAVMAADLADTPATGIDVQLCGDAHLANFGLYASHQRDLLFDLNDFDETIRGPWEWDLKRLVASIAVAGRSNHLDDDDCHEAALWCADGYRSNLERLEDESFLDVWYEHLAVQDLQAVPADTRDISRVVQKAIEKAKAATNESSLAKLARRGVNGAWQFIENPPQITRTSDSTPEKIVPAMNAYAETLPAERRRLLERYQIVDMVQKVVGVGSVGLRCYVIMLFGNGETDPLFLQLKQAEASSLTGPLAPSEYEHHGQRVVHGQQMIQAVSDILLGWMSMDGRDFYVRQLKDMKGSIQVESLSAAALKGYAYGCGQVLGRAHARSSDAATLAGYCGTTDKFDNAFANFAMTYADQAEKDHAELKSAIKAGKIAAEAA